MHHTTLAIIDANVRSGQDELTREDLLARLRSYSEPCVTPLWVNWLRERADLRIICMVHDLERLDDFLIDVVRESVGITATRAVLSFGGRVNLDTLMDIPLIAAGNQHMYASNVRIELAPGYDRVAFDGLWNLPLHPHVRPVWLLRTYHTYDSDLNLFLVSSRHADATGYVMSWVRTVEGVVDTVISDINDWVVLANAEQMVEVAERFFNLEP